MCPTERDQPLHPKRRREESTLAAMVGIYCRAHHEGPHPCRPCASLLRYAHGRLAACPFGEEKPVCSKCPVHCYGRTMRERVRDVMRYAGPRMMLHHPVTAVRHLVREKRPVKNAVEYLPDETIDHAMDRQIRDLLTTCFTGPQDFVFKTQRYFAEPYRHRWIIRDGDQLVAHLGVHEKRAEIGDESVPVAGVAEVCVHPEHRGRGHVKNILRIVHPWMKQRGFMYSVLLGKPRVYRSSGYVPREDVSFDVDGERRCLKGVMALELTDRPWPEGEVYLPGPTF